MSDDTVRPDGTPAATAPTIHAAALRARLGRASLRMNVAVSTRGLLAVAALVGGTLLSTAVLVAVATRKLPPGAMPAGMKRSRW
jgi:predicted hotdog family 3-hydroxylacyl-ACP dehydratase